MAATKSDGPEHDKNDGPSTDDLAARVAELEAENAKLTAAAQRPAQPGGLKHVVTYPAISVVWEADGKVHEKTLTQGQYVEDHVPADVAAERTPALLTFGHVHPVDLPAS